MHIYSCNAEEQGVSLHFTCLRVVTFLFPRLLLNNNACNASFYNS